MDLDGQVYLLRVFIFPVVENVHPLYLLLVFMHWYFNPRKDGINSGFHAFVDEKDTVVLLGNQVGMAFKRICVVDDYGMSLHANLVTINSHSDGTY